MLLSELQPSPDMLAELHQLLITHYLDGIYTLIPPGTGES
jgi:hypothetical protein